jgi:hypothetical protein
MDKSTPYLGVIEGFFGRTWSFAERYDYAEFLKNNGYQFYIYAPKADSYLRKSWQQDWPDDTAEQLQNLVSHYQDLGLDFGLGLSPFEIYKNYNADARQSLQDKIKRLNELGVDILCLLFDDMRGDQPDLAQMQINVTRDVLAQTTAKKVIMCPTYYSFAAKLEKVFGSMPENYFQDLGNGLPPEVDIFWTGPEICSQDYPESHLKEVIQLLGRKPFIWDNYPVNDGADISQFLFLKSFENRPASMAKLTTGHAVNPMNQSWLSRIPLYSLPRSYAQGADYHPEQVLQESLSQLCGPELAQQIANDIDILQAKGLDKMEPEQRQQLIQHYSCFDNPVDSLYAREIIAWLKDEYVFDPTCLTG